MALAEYDIAVFAAFMQSAPVNTSCQLEISPRCDGDKTAAERLDVLRYR